MKCFQCERDICICNLPSDEDLQNWREANDYTNEGDEPETECDNA